MQLAHHNHPFHKRTFAISLIANNIQSSLNIGGLFRTADAFGAEHLHICGDRTSLDKKIQRMSRSSEKYVKHSFHVDCAALIEELKEKEYLIIALEVTNTSKAIHNFDFPQNKKVAIILGDENFGVDEKCLEEADLHLHIEMFGENSSMNVVQAGTIALYEFSKQKL